jgi:serine/threonine protein kinase
MYKAPEIFEGVYNEKIDIWAAGIVFFLLVTGKFPIENENLMLYDYI